MSKQGPIRTVAISGSVRPGNYTGKALALVVDEFSHHKDAALEVINPAEIDLVPPGTGPGSYSTQHLRDTVSGATGVILATPEYHGSFSSIMKLVIENLGFPSALNGKPIALLGVAAGEIGAIKIARTPSQCLFAYRRDRAPPTRFRSEGADCFR